MEFPMFADSHRPFSSLSEAEVLGLAISSEEDDARIYQAFAQKLQGDYPDSAKIFRAMAEVEQTHRNMLIDMFRTMFGEDIPLVRREHVKGFYSNRPIWLLENLPIETIRAEAERMEDQSAGFYEQAVCLVRNASLRRLLGDLALAERGHQETAQNLTAQFVTPDKVEAEVLTAKRKFLLTYVQPGLAGLMDGSVSTLAPIFAAAFATQDTWQTFLIGLSASVGAGISMGFTEAAHDDGKLTGRGSPLKRGLACGIMTTVGGLGHALPYLIPHFWTATVVAAIVVFFELWAIALIQNKFMETPFLRAAFQVVLGGSLVLAAGILIGNG
jgi:rubrerythrin